MDPALGPAAFVEIHDPEGALEAEGTSQSSRPSPTAPHGKRGLAIWDEVRGLYVVETLDGLLFDAPAAGLRACEPVGPEDGGFDLAWPPEPPQPSLAAHASAAQAEQELVAAAAWLLQQRGFCVLHVPAVHGTSERAVREALAAVGYCLPDAEMAEAYLGSSPSSKLSWFAAGPWDALCVGPARHVAAFGRAAAAQPGLLDFAPSALGERTCFRVPLLPGERERMGGAPPLGGGRRAGGGEEQEEEEEGRVARHLDFLQRRRLCLMHFLESAGGTVELRYMSMPGVPPVRLDVVRGRLLVFRHDAMGYTYQPRPGSTPADDVVVQGWVLEEPPVLRVDGVDGEAEEVSTAALGGQAPPQPVHKQVHIMSAACRFPGGGYQLERAWEVFKGELDSFLEMPKSRWDVDVYYAEDTSQFGAAGKSGTKHAGLLDDEEMAGFDNRFFGIPDEQACLMPPTTRLLMELSFEAFNAAGYSRETLRGANVSLSIADAGMEWDMWAGINPGAASSVQPYSPETWAISTFYHGITSGCQLASNFGTTGPVKLVDTACSASLVAASINHAALRRNDPKHDFRDALSMGHQGMFSPFAFIGLSNAGMLGRGGRCFTFDQSANGYNRGEGVGGLLQRVATGAEEAEDRLGNYVSSFINQDGRSASLTAPNGPSQQAVIRSSMAMENLQVEDICLTENHGTGTALGDPIEVGSVRSVFRSHPTAIPVSSGKTHLGHLEVCAGSVGLLKVLLSLLHMANPPNVHLRQLNAHIDVAGFPGLFPIELTDVGLEYATAGLNGFGFGGTNCRSELWARCVRGPRSAASRKLREPRPTWQPLVLGGRDDVLRAADCAVTPCAACEGPMCWRCGLADPAAECTDDAGERRRHRCLAIREEFASYDVCSNCFEGGYSFRAATLGSVVPQDREA